MEKNSVIVKEVKDQIKLHIKQTLSTLTSLLDYVEASDDF